MDENKEINDSEIEDTDNKSTQINESEDINTNAEVFKISEELAQAKDSFLRLSAEFDNYRKRTLTEKYDLIKTAGEDIIKELLPVIDDFDRAMEAITSSGDVEALAEGVNLIHDKMLKVLKSKGLKLIEANGADFNPDTHEAVAKIPSEDQKGKVMDVVQKGYALNEKIIRYPKVVVGE